MIWHGRGNGGKMKKAEKEKTEDYGEGQEKGDWVQDSDGGWRGYIPAKYLKSLTNKQRKGIVSEIMYAREKMEFFERALGQLEGVVSEEVK